MVEWTETTLGTIGVFSKGKGISKAEAHTGIIPCVRYGEIYTHHNDYVRVFNSYISPNVATTSRRLKKGELLFAGSGETKEEIGKCVAFVDDSEVYAGGDIIILTPNTDVDPLFMGYYLNSPKIIEQKASRGQGDAIVHITAKSLSEVKIELPPLSEQHAIAEILSDMDGYIAALEKLIVKKTAVKQGAMQELLTGKRLLPGFNGEWVEKCEIFEFHKGAQVKALEFGKYPHYNGGQINSNYAADYNTQDKIIISEGGNSCGYVNYIYGKFWAGGHCYVIDDTGFDKFYLYNLLKLYELQIMSLRVGSGLPNIQSKGLRELSFRYTTDVYEQTAIAAILSDMDEEIDTLTAKLNKIRNIKQGMMQELLTGRIRLLETEAVIETKSATKIIKLPKTETSKKAHRGHSEGYEDAVILAALVNVFGTEQYPFTAFDCQKFPYLFHRHIEGVAKGFKKFAAGPYNSAYKYKTARPIALDKKYIREHTGNYKGFVTDINAQEALNYFTQWYGDEPIKWMEQFRYIPKRKDELELLTTTDKAMVELLGKEQAVTLQTVKELIKKSPAWKDKLKRPIFSDENIARAIRWSNELFGTEAQPQ